MIKEARVSHCYFCDAEEVFHFSSTRNWLISDVILLFFSLGPKVGSVHKVLKFSMGSINFTYSGRYPLNPNLNCSNPELCTFRQERVLHSIRIGSDLIFTLSTTSLKDSPLKSRHPAWEAYLTDIEIVIAKTV